jgi:hypothetical protein
MVFFRQTPSNNGIFLVRYQSKIRDTGMLMPPLVSSMPTTTYVAMQLRRCTQRSATLLQNVMPLHFITYAMSLE